MSRVTKILNLSLLAVSLYAQDPVSWTTHTITSNLVSAKKVFPVDLDQDGDIDWLAAASNTSTSEANVAWFENDGSNNYTFHHISNTLAGARSVWAADVTGDGYPDILAGANGDYPLTLYKNDSTPANDDLNWATQAIGNTDSIIYSIHTKDIDKDGDQDILCTYFNFDTDLGGDKVRWFRNDGMSGGNLQTTENILVSNYESAGSVYVDDFNNDGEWDILTTAEGLITSETDLSWWSNNGAESFTKHTISTTTDGPWFASTADMDNDGDADILLATYTYSPSTNRLMWWENINNGASFTAHIIITGFTNGRSILAVDMDGDGDMDIAAAADDDNTIAWFENEGSQNFTRHDVTTSFTYAYFVHPYDGDGDGDTDLFGTAQNLNQFNWWESDLAEEITIASGNAPAQSFLGGKVSVDFASGDGGQTSAFYNAGQVSNRLLIGSGLHHVAARGFFTIVTAAQTYTADLIFDYGAVAEWSAITNETDLRICLWNPAAGPNGAWEIAGSTAQQIDQNLNTITVPGLTSGLAPYSLFTLGSVSVDNPLPVELVSFIAVSEKQSVRLEWRTAAELDHLGFEIWRSTGRNGEKMYITGFEENPALLGQGNRSQGALYQHFDSDVQVGLYYEYTLVDVSVSGQRTRHAPVLVLHQDAGISVLDESKTVAGYNLTQNYPNPFNNRTTIRFSISGGGEIPARIAVYDLNGRLIKVLWSAPLLEGTYQISWDGTNQQGSLVSSGDYIYGIETENYRSYKRLTLIK